MSELDDLRSLAQRALSLVQAHTQFDVGPFRHGLIQFSAIIADADTASTTLPRFVVRVPAALQIVAVEMKLNKNETCGATSVIADIHKITAPSTDGQGTTMYTTQANRPTITSTNIFTAASLPDVLNANRGDFLGFFVDQSGTDVTSISINVEARRR